MRRSACSHVAMLHCVKNCWMKFFRITWRCLADLRVPLSPPPSPSGRGFVKKDSVAIGLSLTSMLLAAAMSFPNGAPSVLF